MGVYIKDMEMPKCCAECVVLHDNGNWLTCLITHEPRGYMFPDTEERMSNCPLIPVPPHGRLIDADAFEAEYWSAQFWGDRDAAKKVHRAPTVIPADPVEVDNDG